VFVPQTPPIAVKMVGYTRKEKILSLLLSRPNALYFQTFSSCDTAFLDSAKWAKTPTGTRFNRAEP